MAISLILSTDTLEAGFRAKANANFNEIIQSVQQPLIGGNPSGVFRLIKSGGGFIDLVLTDQYYTKSQVATLIGAVSSSPYYGAWDGSKVPYAPPAVTDHNGTLWRANTSTTTEPGTDATWDNILSEAVAIEFDFPAGGSNDFTINYVNDVTAPGIEVYSEAYYTDLTIDPTGANIFIPYTAGYFKVSANNTIIVRRQDSGDHIKITIKR